MHPSTRDYGSEFEFEKYRSNSEYMLCLNLDRDNLLYLKYLKNFKKLTLSSKISQISLI